MPPDCSHWVHLSLGRFTRVVRLTKNKKVMGPQKSNTELKEAVKLHRNEGNFKVEGYCVCTTGNTVNIANSILMF